MPWTVFHFFFSCIFNSLSFFIFSYRQKKQLSPRADGRWFNKRWNSFNAFPYRERALLRFVNVPLDDWALYYLQKKGHIELGVPSPRYKVKYTIFIFNICSPTGWWHTLGYRIIWWLCKNLDAGWYIYYCVFSI